MAVEQYTKQQIINQFETEFRQEFGEDIDLTESSVFSTLAAVHAEVFANNQEEDLQEVYESAFLDTATGHDLDRVVAIVGISRRSARHATGVQRFVSDTPVASTYTIQKGTTVQTSSNDPIQFETTEVVPLKYFDGFEDGALDTDYAGDTGAAMVVSTHPSEGSYELELNATADAHVYHETETFGEGGTLHFDTYAEATTVPIFTFGVQDASNYYQVRLDPATPEIALEKVEGGAVTQTIDSLADAPPSGEYADVELDWSATGDIKVVVTDSGGAEYIISGSDSDDPRWRDGNYGFKSGDVNAKKYFDEVTTSAVSADLRATVGGEHGNVGANSITVLPSPPAGVDETRNPLPTGANTYTDLDDEPFVTGVQEETDAELRQRAKDSVSKGGDATHDSIVSKIVNDIDGITSVTVYENKTNNDNTGTGGLPPHAFEVVVHGGDDQTIAEAIHDKKALTAHDYGGAHGSKVSKTVTADSNGQDFTIEYSRPNQVSVDFTMDIVVDDTFVGEDTLRDHIVEYVGGENTDEKDVIGLEPGDDIRLDRIEDIVVGTDTGVVGFNSNASTEEITTTPSKTTDGNGLEIVAIGENEVAQTNATDGSITINTTEI